MYRDFRSSRSPGDLGPRAGASVNDTQGLPSGNAMAMLMQAEQLSQTINRSLSSDGDGPQVAGYQGYGRDPIQGVVKSLSGHGYAHRLQMLTWHLMRQYSPTLDNVINMCRMLEGDTVIRSEDEGLERELTERYRSIPIGYIASEASQTGLSSYLNLMADAADEYGLGVGEMLVSAEGDRIARLVVPNTRTISIREVAGTGLYGLYQSQTERVTAESIQQDERRDQRIDTYGTVQTLVFRPSAEDVWPQPLAWSAVTSTEAVLRMYQSVLNGWWRFGDPSLLNKVEFDPDSNMEMITLPNAGPDGGDLKVPTALFVMSDRLNEVAKARRQGKVKDANVFVDGGDLSSETLGDVDASLLKYFKEHASVFDAHVVEAAPLPAFLFPHIEQSGDGLGSSRSQSIASIAATAAEHRNARKLQLAREIIDADLTLRGEAQFVGQYRLETEAVDIMDDKLQAEADKMRAEADAQVIENVVQAYEATGERRFSGDAERHLEEAGIYPSANPNA